MNPDDQHNQELDPGKTSLPYPGYGQRHDIFYQGPPVDRSSQISRIPLKNPQPLKPDNQIALEYYAPAKTGKSHRGIFVIGAVLVVIVITVGAFLAFAGDDKSKNSKNTKDQATTTPQDNTQSTNTVTTTCYTFTLPSPHGPISDQTICGGSYLSGANRAAGVNVSPTFYPFANISEMVADWKSSNPNITVVSETNLKFGNYDALGVIWTSANTPDATYMTVLTYVGFDPIGTSNAYTAGDSVISGFQIKGRYDNQFDSKKIFDDILASWQWK